MGCTLADRPEETAWDGAREGLPTESSHLLRSVRRGDPGSVPMLGLLVRMGARPWRCARELGLRCVEEDRPDVLEFLMNRREFRDEALSRSTEILGLAYDQRKTHFLADLLGWGAGLSGVDPISGRTLLMKAVARGDRAVATWLLESGACIEEEVPGVGTALHVAAAFRTDMIDPLVELGACVRKRTSEGVTPLYASLKAGNHPSAARLMHHGAVLRDDVPSEELWDLYRDLCNRTLVPLHLDAAHGSDSESRATVDRRLFEESVSRAHSEPLRRLEEALLRMAVLEDAHRVFEAPVDPSSIPLEM